MKLYRETPEERAEREWYQVSTRPLWYAAAFVLAVALFLFGAWLAG